MITIPELFFQQRYTSFDFKPLRITAVYSDGASRVNYQPQTLDNLLASQVLKQAGVRLTDNPDAYDIPLPLECLWRNDDGWPLWAASYFWPESETHQWTLIQHKRAIGGYWTAGRGKARKLAINTASGKHKEKRMPVPVETTEDGRYTAYCIGHAETIAELLAHVRYLSGRRGIGMGRLSHFEIAPAEIENVLIIGDKLSRAIPLGSEHLLPDGVKPATGPVAAVGWTPPQWKPTLFSAGWFAGATVTEV